MILPNPLKKQIRPWVFSNIKYINPITFSLCSKIPDFLRPSNTSCLGHRNLKLRVLQIIKKSPIFLCNEKCCQISQKLFEFLEHSNAERLVHQKIFSLLKAQPRSVCKLRFDMSKILCIFRQLRSANTLNT
jgi:hypothetical protein